MIITRRSFLTGIMAAPLIVKATSIMPVRALDLSVPYDPYHSDGWGINERYRFYIGPLVALPNPPTIVSWSTLEDPTVWP